MTAGYLTHPAHGGHPFAAVLATVILATVAGANYGYVRGRRGLGTALRLLEDRHPGTLDRVGTRPRTATFAAQCTGCLRTLFPRVAAGARVPYRRFAVTNLAAACTWGAGLLLAGHLAGTALDRVRTVSSLVGLPLLLAALAGCVLCRCLRRRRSQRVSNRPL
ncbi:DedA family protein [Spirillospora sp. CA-294931]|uniref:DedA family protein n=1 Tax=Spirillospora sp. CA-294931 TaxID=3240042 RepID=UPI003D8EF6E7